MCNSCVIFWNITVNKMTFKSRSPVFIRQRFVYGRLWTRMQSTWPSFKFNWGSQRSQKFGNRYVLKSPRRNQISRGRPFSSTPFRCNCPKFDIRKHAYLNVIADCRGKVVDRCLLLDCEFPQSLGGFGRTCFNLCACRHLCNSQL